MFSSSSSIMNVNFRPAGVAQGKGKRWTDTSSCEVVNVLHKRRNESVKVKLMFVVSTLRTCDRFSGGEKKCSTCSANV